MNEQRFNWSNTNEGNNNEQLKKINKMKNLVSIKHYPSNFEIAYEENDETTVHSLSYDGLKGELTREDWKEDCLIADFDEIDQDEILDYMNIYEIFANENKQLSYKQQYKM